MPQRLIESKLARRRDEGGGKLLGECAMQLGKELGKAMVSVVASLTDGTLVSGLDNGRMQLWRHGVRLKEVMHNPPGGGFQAMMGTAGPVACIAVLPGGAQHKDKALAFATVRPLFPLSTSHCPPARPVRCTSLPPSSFETVSPPNTQRVARSAAFTSLSFSPFSLALFFAAFRFQPHAGRQRLRPVLDLGRRVHRGTLCADGDDPTHNGGHRSHPARCDLRTT